MGSMPTIPMRRGLWAPILFVVWSCGCASPDLELTASAEAEPVVGEPVSIARVGGYSHLTLRALFWWQGLGRSLPTEHGIDLYRVEYWTLAPDERTVVASGLVGIPRNRSSLRGVVSWQHGTASLRTAAPSSLDAANGLLPAAFFAGHGYLLVAPDYLGFGASEEPHSYYHTASMARVVVDLLSAAKTLMSRNGIDWPGHVFLSGFSQGGHASLAAQRLVESGPSSGIRVTASAPVAAAVDLANIGIKSALEGRSRFGSLYVAWIALTYSRDYGEPMESVLREPWSSTVAGLFDGYHDGDFIVEALPSDPTALLTDEARDAIDNGQPHWFLDRLTENGLLEWTPKAPVRIYYGEQDVDVTSDQAALMQLLAEERGADVVAVSVGQADHEASILLAAPLLRDWFDSLSGP
jgi:pimeloyl-ACP methyl ester carboxylesterase